MPAIKNNNTILKIYFLSHSFTSHLQKKKKKNQIKVSRLHYQISFHFFQMHDRLFEKVGKTLQEVQASFSWCDGDSLPCKGPCCLLWGHRAGALKHNVDHVTPSGGTVQNAIASSKLFPGTVSPRDLVTPKCGVSCEPDMP